MAVSRLRETISEVKNFMEQIPWNRRQEDPEWLKLLLGDSPLLRRYEYEFISQVRNSITKEVRSKPNVPPKRHLKKKLSVMEDNFGEVVKYLKENSENKNYFLHNYPPWQWCRENSISQLLHIANVVDKKSKESAAVGIAGSSVSLAGGLMSLIPGLGPLRIAGGVLVGLGSLAAFGASVLEFQELKEKIKEAEQIMLKDRELSESLWDWMNDMSRIQEAYDTITSVDVDLKRIAKDLHASYKKKTMIIGKAMAPLKVLGWISDDAKEVIGILLALFMLYDNYQSSFNIVFETYNFKRALSTAYNVATGTVKIISVVNASRSSKMNPFNKYRLGIGIALDVISIINAAKDFEETSKEAIAITEAAKKLKEEAEVFKKLYVAVLDEAVCTNKKVSQRNTSLRKYFSTVYV